MARIEIDFEEAFRSQRELADRAIQQLGEVALTLDQLLPGEDPETGLLAADISKGMAHLSELVALVREQKFRNR